MPVIYIYLLTEMMIIMALSSRTLNPKRVHIAPVGFEIDRVVIPAIQMDADKLYLIIDKDENDKGVYCVNEIKNQLSQREKGLEIIEVKTDFRRLELYDALKIYRTILMDEKENHIFINVSTGSKIHSIAGMMTSMIFKEDHISILPYYVQPEKYELEPEHGEQLTRGCKGIQILPEYRIEKPSDGLLRVLDLINKNMEYDADGDSRGINKKRLIAILNKEKISLIEDPVKNEVPAKYRALERRYIDPLLKWKYIRIEKRNRKAMIHVKKEGKDALHFLCD